MVLAAALALVAGGLLAPAPATAVQTTSGGTVNAGPFTVTGGSIAANPEAAGTTNTITTTAPRTLLDFETFNLVGGNRLDINVSDRSHIVLIRVPAGSAAQVNGFLNVTNGTSVTSAIGDVPTNVGGNVWFVAPTGVAFGGTSRVRAGGLLATTQNPVLDDDFTTGDTSLDFVGGSGGAVNVETGAELSVNGGLLALVAPTVSHAGQISDPAGAGAKSEVLFGAAEEFTLTSEPDSAFDLDLLGFTVPVGGAGGPLTPVTLAGTTMAGNVYVSSTSSNAVSNVVSVEGKQTATGAVASGDGDVVLAAGRGLVRPAPGVSGARAPMVPTAPIPGLPPQYLSLWGPSLPSGDLLLSASRNLAAHSTGDIRVRSPLTASSDVVLDSGRDLALESPATLDTLTGGVTLVAGDDVSSPASAVPTGTRWAVYAPTPDDIAGSSLDSTNPAIWGENVSSRPPSSLSGNRYVFAQQRTLTFTASPVTKNFGTALSMAQLPYTDDHERVFHGGITGKFLADSMSTAVEGQPDRTSRGAAAGAPVPLLTGSYPIDIAQSATLSAPTGYEFAFVDGTLSITDTSAPVIGVTVTGTSVSGWYTTDVTVDWTVTEDESEFSATGCDDFSITADQDETDYPCVVDTFDFPDTTRTLENIRRDATDPVITAASSVGGVAIAEGTWTNSDVDVTFTCSDTRSGVATSSPDLSGLSATQVVDATCTDVAGNTGTVSHQVNIDKVLPTTSNETLRYAGSDALYGGEWTTSAVDLSWDCADATPGSGVDPTGQLTADAAGEYRATCTDGAGNVGSSAPFQVNIDRTGPVFGDLPDVTAYTTRSTGTASWAPPTATDAGAGLDRISCDRTPGTSFARGRTTVTCTATDALGNTTTDSFVVWMRSVSVRFGSPVDAPAGLNTALPGRIVPVRISLLVDGRAVTRSTPVPLTLGAPARMSCSVPRSSDRIEQYASTAWAGNGFRWYEGLGLWQHNVRTADLATGVCYRVPIDLGGTQAGFFYLQPRR